MEILARERRRSIITIREAPRQKVAIKSDLVKPRQMDAGRTDNLPRSEVRSLAGYIIGARIWISEATTITLMSVGDELKLQRGAAANMEREQGNEGGKNCDHAHDGTAVARKFLDLLDLSEF